MSIIPIIRIQIMHLTYSQPFQLFRIILIIFVHINYTNYTDGFQLFPFISNYSRLFLIVLNYFKSDLLFQLFIFNLSILIIPIIYIILIIPIILVHINYFDNFNYSEFFHLFLIIPIYSIYSKSRELFIFNLVFSILSIIFIMHFQINYAIYQH